MADQLKNILSFTVAAGNTVAIPHNLNEHGHPLIPDRIEPDVAGLDLSADATNVFAHNPTGAPITSDVLCEAWHTIERAFGPEATTHLVPQPFIALGGNGPLAMSGSINVDDEGAPIPNNPHTVLNFVGAGVTATDSGAGVAEIAIPGGITVEDIEGPIAGNPHTTLNFEGAGVAVVDNGGGVATVTIPGGSGLPDIVDVPGISVTVLPTTAGMRVECAALAGGATGLYVHSTIGGLQLLAVFDDIDAGGLSVGYDSNEQGLAAVLGNVFLAGNIQVGGPGEVSPGGSSGTFNNVELGPTGPLYFVPDAGGQIITGIVPVNSQSVPNLNRGVLLWLINGGVGTVTLKHNNAGSAAGHRFLLPSAADVVIPVNGFVELYYTTDIGVAPYTPGVWLLKAKGF